MKNIARIMLKKGMILAEDVLDFQNNLLYPANTVITDQIISRLTRYSIMCVNIKEEKELADTHYEKLHLDETFKAFQIIYQDALYKYKTIILSLIEHHNKFEDNKLISLYQNVTSFTNSPVLLLDYLYNMMSSEDELTHIHCFNSALLAGSFADWLHLSEQEEHQLILCAFYSDVGKWKIRNYILWKLEKLNPAE